MSKSYFTKFLPVEGEIKEGDKYSFGNRILTMTKEIIEKEKSYLDMSDEELDNLDITEGRRIKHKLFLCSRDIQAGDTFTDNVGRLWKNAEECFAKVAREANEQNSEYGKGSYKVIGEISPEATWVKENMEFDERDLAFNSDESEERLPVGKGKVFLMGFDWAKPEADYKGFIYIKCPCGHFH